MSKQTDQDRIITRYRNVLEFCLTPQHPRHICNVLNVDKSVIGITTKHLMELGLMIRHGKERTHHVTYETVINEFTLEHYNIIYNAKEHFKIKGSRTITMEDLQDKHIQQSRLDRIDRKSRGYGNVSIGSSFSMY